MIVLVDCTDLPPIIREDLFMSSRDRMREIDEKTAIEESVIEYIKEHQTIKQLNVARRQKRLESALSEEETTKILQSLVQSDPTLAHLFGKGDIIRVPGKDIQVIEPYEGQKFPTYFRLHNEPKDGLIKHCPINKHCRIECETDAANGYFDRLDDPGRIECRGLPQKLSHNLGNGKANIKFGLPTGASIGDEFKVEVLVYDVSRADPFRLDFRIHIDPEAPDLEPRPHIPPGGATLAAMPNIREVYREKWASEDFNEMSALKIDPSGEDDDALDIAINMDNIYLRNEIAKRKNVDAKLLTYWFKWGLVLLALGMINTEKRRNQDESVDKTPQAEKDDLYEKIDRASEGIAVTLIPVISHMNKKQSLDDE